MVDFTQTIQQEFADNSAPEKHGFWKNAWEGMGKLFSGDFDGALANGFNAFARAEDGSVDLVSTKTFAAGFMGVIGLLWGNNLISKDTKAFSGRGMGLMVAALALTGVVAAFKTETGQELVNDARETVHNATAPSATSTGASSSSLGARLDATYNEIHNTPDPM